MLSVERRQNSSRIFSQDSQRCSSVTESAMFWARWDKHQNLSQEEFYLCQCSMTFSVTDTTTKMNVEGMPTLWRHLLENFVLVNGHLLNQVLRKSGILPRIVHKEPGTILRKKCYWNSQKADTLSSVRWIWRTTPLSLKKGYSRKQRTRKVVYTFHRWSRYSWYNLSHYSFWHSAQCLRSSDRRRENCFYETQPAICEEFEDHQDRTGQTLSDEHSEMLMQEL